MTHLEARVPWSTEAPPPRSHAANQPTLLFSWWCTGFAAAIIVTRVLGRKVRSNALFREDWIMLAAMVPLFIRMGFIHVVLIWGTNNIETAGYHLTAEQLLHHSIGARLVLAARVFYAAFIWMSKWTVSEFLKRITARTWRQSYEMALRCIRAFLIVTFIGVVIATIAECQPIEHYWQVIPDPGPQCRQGYAQLLTMGVCDIITDILLVTFPIPIILTSGASWKRKLQLAALFSLSLIMIAITALRMPEVMLHQGRQQYRTVWASCEILAATAVSNAVVLGSFLRDKGTKRNKFRGSSLDESAERASVRRPTLATLHPTCSDEDLFRSFGCRIPDHLQEKHSPVLRPAPPAFMSDDHSPFMTPPPADLLGSRSSHESHDSMRIVADAAPESPPQTSRLSHSNFDFSDMGGLLEKKPSSPPAHAHDVTAPSPMTTERLPAVITLDFASYNPQFPERGDATPRSLMQHMAELGVLPSPSVSRSSRSSNDPAPSYFRALGTPLPLNHQALPVPRRTRDHASRRAPIGIRAPMLDRRDMTQTLQDAGGLLGPLHGDLPAVQTSMAGHGQRHAPRDSKTSLAIETRSGYERSATPTRGSMPPSPARRFEASLGGRSHSPKAPDDLILHDAGGLVQS